MTEEPSRFAAKALACRLVVDAQWYWARGCADMAEQRWVGAATHCANALECCANALRVIKALANKEET